MRKKLSSDQIVEIWRRREKHVAWGDIALAFGMGVEALRRRVDPQYRAERNAYRAKKKQEQRVMRDGEQGLPAAEPVILSGSLPADLAERGRHPPPAGMALVSFMMGDPVPDYLQRRAEADRHNDHHQDY